jgi:hypothetical protein
MARMASGSIFCFTPAQPQHTSRFLDSGACRLCVHPCMPPRRVPLTSEMRRNWPRALLPRSKKNFFCSARTTRAALRPPSAAASPACTGAGAELAGAAGAAGEGGTKEGATSCTEASQREGDKQGTEVARGRAHGGLRSVPSVSIEATEHQSEAPADGLVCALG